MNLPKVTIGIPAYNEEANIVQLLSSLLAQKQEEFQLAEIFVNSDGSTDRTVEKAISLADPRIAVADNRERQGIGRRLNEIASRPSADVLVVLNADIMINDSEFLRKLVRPVLSGQADLAACRVQAAPGQNFFERSLAAGLKFRSQAFESWKDGDNLFTCNGTARAMSRRFYSALRFPRDAGEDMYSYFFCRQKGFKYYYQKQCQAMIKLPDNWRDHLRQSLRFAWSAPLYYEFFGRAQVKAEMSLPRRIFLKTLAGSLRSAPIKTAAYLAVWSASRLLANVKQRRPDAWNMALSSKSFGPAPAQPSRSAQFWESFFIRIRRLGYGLIFYLAPAKISPGLAILCYHDIGQGWYHGVAKADFSRQLDFLLKKYQPAVAEDLGSPPAGWPSFLLTFDDGYKSVMEVADLIKTKGLKPILFILSRPAQADCGQLGNDRELLAKEDILRLAADGWEIGCHGSIHRDFFTASAGDLMEEIVHSKREIESWLGKKVKYFAYPRGRYNSMIRKTVQQAGYQAAFSLDDGLADRRQDFFALPRVSINGTYSFMEFRSSLLLANMRARKFVKKIINLFFSL